MQAVRVGLLLLLFSWPPLSALAQTCQTPLHVAYNDWPPYSWSDEGGEPLGLDIDLLKAFARRAGCMLEFDKMPARRSHQLMHLGKVDIMMGASKTVEREEYAHFSVPYRLEQVGLFSIDNGAVSPLVSWQQVLDSDLKLLVPQAGWYGEAYESSKRSLAMRNQLVESPDLLKSVQMLSRGRAELAIGDALALPFIASQQEKVHLFRHPLRLTESDIHLMFSRFTFDEARVRAFDDAIRGAAQDGEIAALLLKWEQISLSRIEGVSQQLKGSDDSIWILAD
ncbi:substrate-binding periplasmic protein [Shewanella litorisediminis]|uniref:Transporter substrate-binding domain-containing protein n=1 Tax=Shewanella litorisediminis TaxID=1173586 RepID=A0ABX7G6J8_9GAMM|nr:transporter substrate-binding domain-containing protein [Shewanella litorisediminis]MCL2917690.1 transporter substrate-binding domain-containing protein [Shewanella litorisediminis]QRH02810.1 transporter substrate-binding domain-containing protein [Shewanella litorisediminis]